MAGDGVKRENMIGCIPPLIDLGIITKDGRIVASMQHKYRQINRFLEMVDDAVRKHGRKTLKVVDFGCGKSYLTFIVYYYLNEVRNIETEIVGLDLKEDVVATCNAAALRYGYGRLRFIQGDIGEYAGTSRDKQVDMVMTLHACDTATDYALYHAVRMEADIIFAVPCCQHELNAQINDETLRLLTRYGIVRERAAALMTDAIRANLLAYSGYKAQLMEFVELTHTPKNLLIRAVKTYIPNSVRQRMLAEVDELREAFGLNPTLYGLLVSDD